VSFVFPNMSKILKLFFQNKLIYYFYENNYFGWGFIDVTNNYLSKIYLKNKYKNKVKLPYLIIPPPKKFLRIFCNEEELKISEKLMFEYYKKLEEIPRPINEMRNLCSELIIRQVNNKYFCLSKVFVYNLNSYTKLLFTTYLPIYVYELFMNNNIKFIYSKKKWRIVSKIV